MLLRENTDERPYMTGILFNIITGESESPASKNLTYTQLYAKTLLTIARMPNLVLVTTHRGSHCAHYEGWSPRS